MDSHLKQLFDHLIWADLKLFDALPAEQSMIHKEFAHIVAAEEVWLSRIQKRDAKCAVWPEFEGTESIMYSAHSVYNEMIESLDENDLSMEIEYVNSAGISFSGKLADILTHVALHGQYHRGKVNQMLKDQGHTPVPVDFIAFVRGVPAATKNSL